MNINQVAYLTEWLTGILGRYTLFDLLFPFLFVLGLYGIQWYPVLFPQSFLHHRYYTHLQFKMKKSWEYFFYVLAFFIQGPNYFSVRPYVIMHRMHHEHSDTEKDPHSPKYFLADVFSFAWSMKRKYYLIKYYDPAKTAEEREVWLAAQNLNARDRAWADLCLKPIDPKLLKNLPKEEWLDKVASSKTARTLWAIVYIMFYVFILGSFIIDRNLPGIYWLLMIFSIGHSFLGAIQGTIVNYAAHKWGFRNFDNGDNSTNFAFLVDWLLLGENYQNNHHYSPADPNFAQKWWEFDIMYLVIRSFKLLGIVQFDKNKFKYQRQRNVA